jgi:hypothetical protein
MSMAARFTATKHRNHRRASDRNKLGGIAGNTTPAAQILTCVGPTFLRSLHHRVGHVHQLLTSCACRMPGAVYVRWVPRVGLTFYRNKLAVLCVRSCGVCGRSRGGFLVLIQTAYAWILSVAVYKCEPLAPVHHHR